MQRKVVNVTENPEQGARLESLIASLNLTQVSLAESLGFSQPYISQMVGGSRSISRRVLQFIAKKYPQVNIGWLMNGDGEMFLEKKEPPLAGVLTGVMEPGGEYKGDGSLAERLRQNERGDAASLTGLAALVAEYEEEIQRLGERVGDVERVLLEINRRLAEMEGMGK